MRASRHFNAFVLLVTLTTTVGSNARAEVHFYKDQHGITWREETAKVQRPVRELSIENREQQVYRLKDSTTVQQYQYLTYSPVVQYQWVPRVHDWWRIFRGPYVAYHLEPSVTWQARPYQVSVPTTQYQWVAETQTVQVPVARLKMEEKEETIRTAVQPAPATAPQFAMPTTPTYIAPSYGSPYGGIARMDDGIPRVSTSDGWKPLR